MNLGYAIYDDETCKVITDDNPKMRGFKLNGRRPHTIFLFGDDPVLWNDARMKVQVPGGMVYKAGVLE